jgi:hypothetical protein
MALSFLTLGAAARGVARYEVIEPRLLLQGVGDGRFGRFLICSGMITEILAGALRKLLRLFLLVVSTYARRLGN